MIVEGNEEAIGAVRIIKKDIPAEYSVLIQKFRLILQKTTYMERVVRFTMWTESSKSFSDHLMMGRISFMSTGRTVMIRRLDG